MVILQIEATYALGSTGNIALDLRKHIEQEGWQCYVAYSLVREDLQDDPFGYKVGNWLDHKIHALLCRIHGKQAYFSTIPTLKLIRFIKRIKPDIIQFHDLHSNYVNLNLLLHYLSKTDIKLVLTLHDCWFFTGGCFHYTRIGCNKWQHKCGVCPKRYMDTPAFLGDRSDRILNDRIKYFNSIKDLSVIGVSDWITNEFKKSRISSSRVITIHNGVDLDVFLPTKTVLKKRLDIENKYVILGPASKWFMPINRELLLYFTNNLPSDTVLLIFGCKGQKEDLPKNVIQAPFTRNKKELVELYSTADVFVNCSHEDSLSLINIEAQACGTPVVTYGCTGLKETVDEKTSFSVSPGDYKRMFEIAMELRFSKRNNNVSLLLYNSMKERFSNDKCYSNYIRLYREISNK